MENDLTIKIINENELVLNLRVLYIDDRPEDLDNLVERFEKFNTEQNEFNLKIELSVIEENADVEENIKKNRYNVIICDQNMPEKIGTEFYDYLKPILDNELFIIYSGHADPELLNACYKRGIPHCLKTDFDSLLEIIQRHFDELFRKAKKSGGNMTTAHEFHKAVLNFVLDDLKNLNKLDPEAIIQVLDQDFSPSELISELEKDNSEYSFEYLSNYFEGLTLLNNI